MINRIDFIEKGKTHLTRFSENTCLKTWEPKGDLSAPLTLCLSDNIHSLWPEDGLSSRFLEPERLLK